MSGTLKIVVGSDHAGFKYKEAIKSHLKSRAEILDLGAMSTDSVDYPDFGKAVGQAVAGGKATFGIIVCGSGIGISIAANRIPGVRAALCTSAEMAKLSRQHNNANVLALGERIIDLETALACVDAFLGTEFEGGRHEGRVKKLG
jgi:ribose 5-phosphate isomerase B